MRGTEIHIPISLGEYCCLSGPPDTMASLSAYFLPGVGNRADPVPEWEDDLSTGPDFLGTST
jgi:hypothetical protein